MNTQFYVSFLTMALGMLCVLAAGIFITCRNHGTCTAETVKEVLLWGGGFIVYAIFDYFILMR